LGLPTPSSRESFAPSGGAATGNDLRQSADGLHLCDYLESSAAHFPKNLAVSDSGGVSLTYEELNDQADRVAGFLVERGVKPGDRVGLVLPKTSMAFTALYGIMKAGAAYVPIDWTGPTERAKAILASCEIRTAFVDSRLAGLKDAVEDAIWINNESWPKIVQHEPLAVDHSTRTADDVAYILYTSGSSGIPKGVITTQLNATSYVDWCAELVGATHEDRVGNHAPFHFAICILDIFVPMKSGGSAHLVSEDLGKKPKELARFIADRKITVWYSTPAILGMLAESGDLAGLDCSSLRHVLFAGEPFPLKKLRRLIELWPAPTFHNLWGSTETNACAYARIPKPIPEERTEAFPIGTPASHCTIKVLNEDGEPVKPGEEGLMHIAGTTVFPGYWGRETSFIYQDGKRWHNTGDVVKEVDSEGLVYVCRRDRMVKRRGFRIELGEVERALYRHPAISETAVIALPDPQQEIRVLAYLVTSREPRPSIIEMKTFCHKNLPSYMNPDVFHFIESLPRTRSNKVDYQTLIKSAR
jgi:amino acid adenylation domain-containing protein